ncbi:MAG: ABC transporter ATP-binding protein [Planctomycetota bacterium]
MAAIGDTIISVRELACGYGETLVLENVSFDVRRGEVFVVIGGSGCGKSTLLMNMVGLFEPVHGVVEFEGESLARARGAARTRILRRFGVAYQNGALFGSMTLLENVRLPLEEYTDLPLDAMDLLARMKLKLVGLEAYAEFQPAEISGGMQKRAGIARAMALDPQILFLDEPSAGLDPVTSAELDALILRLARSLGITFIVVTHELPSVYSIADRVIMLDKSARGIIASGTPQELRDQSHDPRVWQFFHRQVAPVRAGGRTGPAAETFRPGGPRA